MGAYVYDKSDYHMGQGADTWEEASGAALFILRWMIEQNFLEPSWWDGAVASIAKYRGGQISLFELYERECDLSLVDDLFTEEGNAFGQLYFDYTDGLFLGDLESVLHNGKSFPIFSEESYALFQPTLAARFEVWKRDGAEPLKKPKKKGWMFWKM